MTAITDFDRAVRLAVYRHFIDTARAPALAELAQQFDAPAGAIEDSLIRLERERALALTPGTNNVWMAHPFSAVPTAYPVRTAERTYWANCAWDALAIPALLGVDSETETLCPDCADRLVLQVRGEQPARSDAVIHFAVPPRCTWDNVGFT